MAVDVAAYEIGEVQTHGNLAVAPVYGGKSGGLDYLVFRDAQKKGLDVVDRGPVEQIQFSNNTGGYVLGITGELVVGDSQNRNLVRNVFFDKNFRGWVPVNCAQHGRSTRNGSAFNEYGGIVPTSVSSVGQEEAWSTIVAHMGDTKVQSGTNDFVQVYNERKPDFEEFAGNFSVSEGQIGYVVGFRKGDKMLHILDIFDSAKTFRSYNQGRLWSHIVEGGLDSKLKVDMSKDDAREFLEKLGSSDYRAIAPVSIGEDFKIRGEGVLGSNLRFDGTSLYTNLFSSDRDELPERVASHREIDRSETVLCVEPMEPEDTIINFGSDSGPDESFDDETIIR